MSASAQPARLITAIFRDQVSAEQAYQCVSERGYDERDIDLIMSDETHKRYFSNAATTGFEPYKSAHGAGLGGAVSGTLGAISAAVTAIGTSLVIPGVGLIVAGPTATVLTGAGGLMGALVDRGVPEEQVEHYEREIKDGGILIGVRTQSSRDAQYFEQQWKNRRGEYVYS